MPLSPWMLPAPVPVRYGLLEASEPITVPWQRGVDMQSGQCLSPGYDGPCEVSDIPTEAPTEPAQFQPVNIRQGAVCSTSTRADLNKLASMALEVRAEYVLGLILETSTNPDLSGGTNLDVFASVPPAIGFLDKELGWRLYGEEGVIHMNPGFLAVAGDAVYRDGSIYRSAGGHRIAASPGYQSVTLIYATGPVFTAVSGVDTRGTIDRSDNTSISYADQAGIAAFDPCVNIQVTVPSLIPA